MLETLPPSSTQDTTSGVQSFDPRGRENPGRVIVIGSGPAGIRFSKDLLKRIPDARITVFGNEPYQPYNRVQLSSLLAGDIEYQDIVTELPNQAYHPNFNLEINAIRSIDTAGKTVTDIHDVIHEYDKLIIATGSRPHEPNIPGVDQPGVYTFRNLKDAEFLYARISRARHVVVIGGGLLGLEAAKALSRFNTKVTVIQQGTRLMNRQLDDDAASYLQEKLSEYNIDVITNSGVREIVGTERVSGVITRDKETIECDTVLVCAGIKPNMEMARRAHIVVGRAIAVNEYLETSATDVYAIGECCEFNGSTYGLVNPGYEHAAILADRLSGGSSHYVGSLEISRLKVLDTPISSMGEVVDFDEKRPMQRVFTYCARDKSKYRKIVTYKGRLIGALGFGEWDESRRIQEAYQSHRRIWPWQYLNFLFTGNLFVGSQKNDIKSWPDAAVVCQCNNISKGELIESLESGNDNLTKLQSDTGAGTVCGSCKPLLSELLGDSGPAEKEKGWATVLVASLLAVVVALLLTFIPELKVSESVQTQNTFESIWNDKYWKQVTGFTLLGLSVIGLLMSLRKRLSFIRIGEFAYWRMLHVVLGVACVSILILHTGFHLGSNFNQMLMIDFLLVIILGAIAGTILSLAHTLKPSNAKRIRSAMTWSHILVTWPLPILLGIHILTVYYF